MPSTTRIMVLGALLCTGLSATVSVGAQSPPSLEVIIEKIADYLGLEKADLHPQTDLLRDLRIGPTAAYEVLVMLCDEFNVPLPEGDGPTVIGEIARYLMETPTRPKIVIRGGGSPDGHYAQTVYYATDRNRTGSADWAEFFDGRRAPGGTVSYGRCTVSIPESHQPGSLESPFLGIQAFASRGRHIQLVQITTLTRENFWAAVSGDVDAGIGDVAVFIHGFNVAFEEAARRTAQIAVDTKFKGIPMMFSWPSDGKALSYLADREDVAWSVPHIVGFLRDVVGRAGDARVHLIAHSMGSQGLLQALNVIALEDQGEGDGPLFANVVLAAPDFDMEVFEQQLIERMRPLARQWTVYASDQDSALLVSSEINSVQRLGVPIIAVADVDMIDASGIEVTPWSVPEFHSYYATKQQLISDLEAVFLGLRPATRGLSARVLRDLTYWQLGAADND